MRILMVAHTFLPESRGGMENHVDLFANYLLSQGHEVGVLYRIHAPEKAEYDLITETREGVLIFKIVHNYTDPMPTPFPFYNRRIEERYLETFQRGCGKSRVVRKGPYAAPLLRESLIERRGQFAGGSGASRPRGYHHYPDLYPSGS